MNSILLPTRFVFILILLLPNALMWEFDITTSSPTVSKDKAVTVLCKAEPGIRLTDCGFQLGQTDSYFNASVESAESTDIGKFSVKPHGTDLKKGECGVQLTATDDIEEVLVGCRGRSEQSGWKYNYTSIVVDFWFPTELRVATEPSTPFLLSGSSLVVRCDHSSKKALERCNFTLPGEAPFDLNQSDKAVTPKGYRYNGTGLNNGQCGIFIPDVSRLDTSAGNVLYCEAMVSAKKILTGAVRIVVSELPAGKPTLDTILADHGTGKTLKATCTAAKSRPPATISWYLDDEPLDSDNIEEVPVNKWRWRKDSETTTQVLTMTNLTEKDEGKEITCVINHMALTETRNATWKITFDDGGGPGLVVGILATIFVVLVAASLAAIAFVKKIACFKDAGSSSASGPSGSKKTALEDQELQPMKRPTELAAED